jgi:predicted type IV restriction endonuclease/tRNA1(Val) A37 N6-methylase TrmN6
MQEEAKEKIKNLIAKYEAEKAAGKIARYSEEETKRGFIEPLFQALGWDFSSKKEITLEEQISGDRVDYGFYLNGRIKFYLEAKKISVDLYREDYAKQAIRYSWNKGVTWAVLSDFEGLIVFNALSPEKSLAGKKYLSFTYEEYLTRFDELWRLSKEAFSADLLDQEAEKVGKKLQKVSVTETLSNDLNECREILTKAFLQWNEKVDPHLIDEGVQKLLNRLIFIRCAEDRKIEPPTLLPLIHEWQSSGKAGSVSPYQAMIKKFRELDAIYNSNLFSEHPFEKWEEFSGATEKVIEILHGKKNYFEYDFSAIPADVLGNVYENYLGHQLKKSKKAEDLSGKNLKKRKEQGIYYTPKFIVDYIVQNALGPVLDKCESINDLQKIKILDPACGSGSFLVAAMNFLIKKYEEFGAKPDGLLKIQILQNNIYGVDLDEQAVELARLNLLLNTFDSQTKLPNLGGNIKNGNSLISGSDEELEKYFGKNWREKKPFNWEEEFPEVFRQGGFDVVIGNPPYIQSRNINDEERHFYWDKYQTDTNHSDIYSFFIEKSIDLLKNQGALSFITPNTWLQTPSFKSTRKKIFDESKILKILTFDTNAKIFGDAQVSNIVFVIQKETNKKVSMSNSIEIEKSEIDFKINALNKIEQKDIDSEKGFNIFISQEPKDIIDKILSNSIVLDSVGEIIGGLRTGDDKKFLKNKFENQNDKKLLRGRNVSRYHLKWNGEYVWYKPELMKVKQAAAPKESKIFETKEKLLVRMITGGELIATFDNEGFYFLQDNLILPKEKYSIKYLLAILNSKLSGFVVKNSVSNIAITQSLLKKFPIYKIDFSKPKEKEKHDDLVKLADKMLKLNKELRRLPENSDKWNSIKSEIEKTNKLIDQKVYELYNLNENEIKIVESYDKI